MSRIQLRAYKKPDPKTKQNLASEEGDEKPIKFYIKTIANGDDLISMSYYN